MKRLALAPEEEAARRTLDLFKRLCGTSDAQIGEWIGVKRQAVDQRLKGYTRVRLPEITALAEGFGIDPACFAMGDKELIAWIQANRPDLLAASSARTAGPWDQTLCPDAVLADQLLLRPAS